MPSKKQRVGLGSLRTHPAERSCRAQQVLETQNDLMSDEQDHITISELPRDLLASVLTFLPRREWLNSTDLVGKAFHRASKHPMCWELLSVLAFTHPLQQCHLTKAIKFFTKHNNSPLNLCLPAYSLPRASFRELPHLSGIRRLTLFHLPGRLISAATALLSSLRKLEWLSMTDAYLVDGTERGSWADLDLLPMPALEYLNLDAKRLSTVHGLENASRLTVLDVQCRELQHASLPPSVTQLHMDAVCSPSVAATISALPNLEYLGGECVKSILSQPNNIAFSHTLHQLVYPRRLGETARANLQRFPHIQRLRSQQEGLQRADMETLGCLSSLTVLRLIHNRKLTDADMAPLQQLTNLRLLTINHYARISVDSLRYIAQPRLEKLRLVSCHNVLSIAPLAACVNLVALQVEVELSEAEAQLISTTLTKLETLITLISCEACFTYLCKLPRLKVLDIQPRGAPAGRFVGHVALQALEGLSSTLERLCMYTCEDDDATVATLCKFTKLREFQACIALTDEHVVMLRAHLPRLERMVYYGSGEGLHGFALEDLL